MAFPYWNLCLFRPCFHWILPIKFTLPSTSADPGLHLSLLNGGEKWFANQPGPSAPAAVYNQEPPTSGVIVGNQFEIVLVPV